MEVLTLREELTEAEEPQELRDISKKVQSKYQACVQELSENFRDSNFEAAKQNTIYLQYYTKILEEVENLLGESILDRIDTKLQGHHE